MKILCIDDHSVVRAGIRPILENIESNVEVLEAESIESALEFRSTHSDIDLVLLDLRIPGNEGFDGLCSIRDQFPRTIIVVVSMLESPDAVMRAIELGALGYIPKSAGADEFLAALRMVLAGEIYLPPAILRAKRPRSSTTDAENKVNLVSPEAFWALTERQREIVKLLGQGRSNKEIAEALEISTSTVRLYMSLIFDKLGLDNRTQVAVWAAKLDAASSAF